jgi:hypothetical protein
MPINLQSKELADQAKFVFQGTVKKLKAANLKSLPASDRTVIVRVDRVLHAPEAVSDFAGQEITVQLAVGETVKVGETSIFYANGLSFAENLAVQSMGHEPATPPAVAALSLHPDGPVSSLAMRETAARAVGADLVVSGRVSALRLPQEESQARAAAMASGQTTERISEHAPLWQEAVINVDEVHKGTLHDKQVLVRFPSSNDVRWHRAPKFAIGQEGVFLLHKEQLVGQAAARGTTADRYTALESADVQPISNLPQIKLAMSGGSS